LRRHSPLVIAVCFALACGGTVPTAHAVASASSSTADTLDSRAPEVSLIQPIGGEDLHAGDIAALRWTIDEESWAGGQPVSVRVMDGPVVLLDDTVLPEPSGIYAYSWPVPDHDTIAAVMRIGAVDRYGWSDADTSGAFTIHGSLSATGGIAQRDGLLPASPNPFNALTEIRFSLRSRADITLSVYDLQGREVARLAQGTWPAGSHSIGWPGRDGSGREVASGTYLIRFSIHDAGRQLTSVSRLSLVK
jgi:hypothetical protein